MSKRTKQVIITPQARVLRDRRKKMGLSMRDAAELIGISKSYLNHIENGRENIPRGERLDGFLRVYTITKKYFATLCSEYKEKETDLSYLLEVLPRLKPELHKELRHYLSFVIDNEKRVK